MRMTSVRQKTVALLLISGLFLGLIFWNFSYEITGQIPPGNCLHLTKSGHELISQEAAVQLLETRLKNNQPLAPQSLACSYWPTLAEGNTALTKTGLTATANEMVRKIEKILGKQSKGGYAPGGVQSGHIKGSAHYEGRAVDFFFRPHTKKSNQLAGWQLATWATVHADELQIATVIFDDHIWTRNQSSFGWRPYVHPSGDTKNPILRHLDHVHIDVS